MLIALLDFFQIMLQIMLVFENHATFFKVCFSKKKQKTSLNYMFIVNKA